MTIRGRFILFNVLLFLMISIAAFIIQRSIIYPAFLRLEDSQAADKINRVFKSIDREIFHLDEVCNDRAQWDDTYEFIDNPSEAYINDNLLYNSFKAARVNLIYICKNDGTLAWGKVYDLEKKETLSMEILKDGRSGPSYLSVFIDAEDGDRDSIIKSGVIDTSLGPMIFTARSILRSDGSGPSKGVHVAGRFLNSGIIDALREDTGVDFGIDYPLTDEKIRAIKDIDINLIEPDFNFYITKSAEFMDVHALYNDISGGPVFSVSFSIPREITQKGLVKILHARIILIVAGFIITATIFLLLHIYIISPLRRLTDHALRLGSEEDYSVRLNIDRRDEVGILAKSFDVMMQTISDRTEDLKAANEKLKQLSQIDGLTGIANRRMFDETMEKEWKRMAREKSPLSLILADVDFFKKYNDLYGHQMGDRCLIDVAGIISENAQRPADLSARYGGEEFAVILPNTDEQGAFSTAEKIRSGIMKLDIGHRGSGSNPVVTMSLGLCTLIPHQGDELSDFIRNADHALYFAKETGRNRTIIFSQLPEVLPGQKIKG